MYLVLLFTQPKKHYTCLLGQETDLLKLLQIIKNNTRDKFGNIQTLNII